MLEYKTEEASARVVAVNPAKTTQACSGRGRIVSKDLFVRVHDRPHCGLFLDRDVNVAGSIMTLALRNPPGRGGQVVT
jgi:putative transposase